MLLDSEGGKLVDYGHRYIASNNDVHNRCHWLITATINLLKKKEIEFDRGEGRRYYQIWLWARRRWGRDFIDEEYRTRHW